MKTIPRIILVQEIREYGWIIVSEKSKKINVIGDGADADIELLATDIEEMNSEEWE